MTWNVFLIGVDQLLELVWVAFSGIKFCLVTESNVFKTMDLSELPENVTLVLSLALNAEDLAQISLVRDVLNHVLEELGLRKGVLIVHSHMVEEVVLSRAGFVILEQTEAANKVVLALVSVAADTFISVGSFLEETHWHLKANPVSSTEDSGKKGVAHPLLAQNSASCFRFSQERNELVGGKSATGDSPHLLDLLNAHHLVDLL